MTDKISYSNEELADMVLELRGQVRSLSREVRDLRELKNPLEDETFMDLEYVCRYLNLSIRHVYRYRQSGELAYVKIGRRVLFRTTEVKRFLDEVLSEKGNTKHK